MTGQADTGPSVLTQQKDILQLIFDNIDERFMLVNPDLKIVFANTAACRDMEQFTGCSFRPGMSVLEIAEPFRHGMLKELYKEVLLGEVARTELQFTDADGETRYFENVFKPARSSGGDVIGVIVASTDISEKKKAEKLLEQAEERWRFALEGTHQGVWDWNIKTGACYYSPAYCALYGFEPDELNGDFGLWLERVHPDDRARMQEHAKQQLEKRERFVVSTYRIATRQGDYKWIEARGMLITDEEGVPERMIGTHVDLTEKLEQEEELKKTYQEIETANERFNMMMYATSDLVWDWDIRNNTFYRGDQGLKRVYGVDAHHQISTAEQWMERVHPEDLENVQAVIAEILNPNTLKTFELEYRFLRDDGTYSHVYDRGLILRDEKGSPVRIIGAAQNISERKRLENEILKRELEHKKILNKATIDSQEQERSEIGRELHDNVNQILTTTKLMLEMSASPKEKDELIGRCIQNISTVINEIRELSRSLMNPSIDDLGIIDSIHDLADTINMTGKVQVICNIDPDIEKRLNKNQKLATFRIVQESINNIIRHATATYTIINLSCEGDDAELIIEDDGQGFNTSTIRKGAGLKNIENRVYLINGTFSIESAKGKGTSIMIRYPLHTNE